MSDQADFAVFDVLALHDMPSLRFDSLGVLQGVYFCRAGHPLLAKPDPQPADLRHYPLVAPSLSLSRMAFIADVDSGVRIDERAGGVLPSISVSSFRSAIDIVAGTDAISLGHPTQIAEGLATGASAAEHALDTSTAAGRNGRRLEERADSAAGSAHFHRPDPQERTSCTGCRIVGRAGHRQTPGRRS